MSSKRLRSVVYSTAHHGMSGLCHVHPYLGWVCRAAGRDAGTIDLLAGRVLVPDVEIKRPLALASKALADQFDAILSAERIDRSVLETAEIEFYFQASHWPASCRIDVTRDDGRTFHDAVRSGGDRMEVSEDRAPVR